MAFLRFNPIVKDRGRSPEKKREEAVKKATENLIKHLPAEATGLFITGLALVNSEPVSVVVVAVVSLAFMLLIRLLARASTAVLITSSLGFVIWACFMQGGIFQVFNLSMPAGIGAFSIVAYSTLITILADAGVLDKEAPPDKPKPEPVEP